MAWGFAMNVRLIDTTIMLNLLGVPNRCADKDRVTDEFNEAIRNGDTLILPIATIIESGNEIAKIKGSLRHDIAERFSMLLQKTADDEAPWSCASFEIGSAELRHYAEHYTESAIHGVGMGDLSIIHTFEKCIRLLPIGTIMIWSTDEHLSSYKCKKV